MKKIALTSLIAMFAAGGASAANVIDGNPLYMPKAGHFYSETDLSSHTGKQDIKSWALAEEFGYGITNKLAVNIATEIVDERSFDQWAWTDLSLGLAYRMVDAGHWKADLLGQYLVTPIWGNHMSFLKAGTSDFETGTDYMWAVGVRGGYVASNWTIAGHALFEYMNTESFNWSEEQGKRGVHALVLGLDGQYVINSHWSVLAGVEYMGIVDNQWRGVPGEAAKVKNAGAWTGELGVNYNIDAAKYVGLYVSGDMQHKVKDDVAQSAWKVQNGFGFGAKFGVDF